MKRKDNKGRELWRGEYQKDDGRYEYRYKDVLGKTRSIYSWTLKTGDIPPDSCPDCVPLREMEKSACVDVFDGIDTFNAKNTPLNDFFDHNMATRNLKESTKENYMYMYDRFVRESLGLRPISSIKYSNIIAFYRSLIDDRHLKPSSMECIHTILHPVFEQAIRDEYIRTNPTNGAMTEIKRRDDWEKTKRVALTEDEQRNLVRFIRSDESLSRWVPVFTFLLGTGCRIGEACALQWSDCDFTSGIININKSLLQRKSLTDGKMRLSITTPKTKNSVRVIPMFGDVLNMLLKLRGEKTARTKTEINGYNDFVFRNRFGEVLKAQDINRALHRIIEKYNVQAPIDKQIPFISCHHLRHTFCTRMCENTSDQNTLKLIQEIMGHSDIATTLDIYTDLTTKKKKSAFASLEGKICVS